MPGRSTRSLERTVNVNRGLWPFATCLLAVGAPHVVAAEQAIVYNHISSTRSPIDEAVHDHFGKRYKVVDVSDKENSWTPPRRVTPPHNEPVFLEGRCVTGQVLVALVIAVDGSVSDAYAVQKTDDFLGALAIEQARRHRFVPAKLDGRAVPSLAGSNFRYPCPKSAK